MSAARPMQLRRWLTAALALGCLCGVAHADVAVPELHSRVTDLTSTLSAAQSSALEQKLASFEQAKGSQIAVLIVPKTQPEEIEQYGIRVAEQWKIGRKGIDDGAILIVAKDDHRLRIEVGYGLEGALNDATAKRIISETITPRFKSGDYAGGIDAGVDQMISVINGEPLPPPKASPLDGSGALPATPGWAILAVVGLIIIGKIVKSAIGGVSGAALTFASVSGLILFIGWPLVLAAVAGLIVMLFAVTPLSTVFAIVNSGGGFSSGGRGGGGFSGGGGGFGGGGASGSW
jgi:uncharacterized protein